MVLGLLLVGSAAQGCDADHATAPPGVEWPAPTADNVAIAPMEAHRAASPLATPAKSPTRDPIDSAEASSDAIEGAPDDAGYLVRPSDSVPRGYDYVPLEAAPLGPFLTAVQERLTAHDAAWLAALVSGDGPSPLALDLLGLDGAKHSATVD